MITGERIRSLRESLGLSQSELAEMVGYSSRSTVAKIESGVIDLTQGKITAFAEALNTSELYLLGMTDDPLPGAEAAAKKDDEIAEILKCSTKMSLSQRRLLLKMAQSILEEDL